MSARPTRRVGCRHRSSTRRQRRESGRTSKRFRTGDLLPQLVAIQDGLWHVEQHHHSAGIHVRVRMVVVRLVDDTLWLHSAVELTEELRRELDELGRVSHVVAPNLGHTRWAGDAKAAFPDATLWGPPGCRERHPKVPWDKELDDEQPWPNDLRAFPLRGTPKVNETVFLHPASRTLICTDVMINVLDEPSLLTRWLYRSIGVWRRAGPASLWKRRTRDRGAAWSSYEKLLDAEFDRVLMAHGDPLEDEPRERMREALLWARP